MNKTQLTLLSLGFLFFLGLGFDFAWAQTASSGSSRPWLLSQGAEARSAKRFTLQEWLENKDRRALMDLWLAANSPTPYELMVGVWQQSYNLQNTQNSTTTTTSFLNRTAEISAYAQIVGLSAEYTNNTDEGYHDMTGLFNLRVFGNSLQSSFWIFHYGLRTRTANDGSYRLNQQFPATTLQIYITKHFGLESHYRYYLPISESHFGDSKADQLSAGLFIEYGILRIYGQWFQERQNSNLNNQALDLDRTGSKVGIRFYF